MIIKTDAYQRRSVRVWERGYIQHRDERAVRVVRREVWWFLFIPIYIRFTVTKGNDL